MFLYFCDIDATYVRTVERHPMNEMRRPRSRDSEVANSTPVDPMARMSEMLMTQALSLDAMFTELAEHAADNLTQWPSAGERYARLALRAQSNCRASLEAIAKADRAKRRAGDGDAH
jgi:hypothetical protein